MAGQRGGGAQLERAGPLGAGDLERAHEVGVDDGLGEGFDTPDLAGAKAVLAQLG